MPVIASAATAAAGWPQGHLGVRRHRDGHSDHRRVERGLAQVMPDGAAGIVKPTVGDPSDMLLDFIEKGRRSRWTRP